MGGAMIRLLFCRGAELVGTRVSLMLVVLSRPGGGAMTHPLTLNFLQGVRAFIGVSSMSVMQSV